MNNHWYGKRHLLIWRDILIGMDEDTHSNGGIYSLV